MMLNWIKRNYALTIGISLPVILFISLSLVMLAVKRTTPPPKYDFIYWYNEAIATQGGPFSSIAVKNNKITWIHSKQEQTNPYFSLYIYRVATNKIEPIKADFSVPVQEISIPGSYLLQRAEAPDGYTFHSTYGFNELGIYKSNATCRTMISKNGKNIIVSSDKCMMFLGWIIPNEQESHE